MNNVIKKTAFLSVALLFAPAFAKEKCPSSTVTFSDIQKIKTCVEFPLFSTPLTGVLSLDPWKCGVKYEKVIANDVTGSGPVKWKTEITIGDSIVLTKWVSQLARTAFVDVPLSTDTVFGEKIAVLSSYLVWAKAEVRAKIAELRAVKARKAVTLEEKRAQVSKIITLKAEIAELLAI